MRLFQPPGAWTLSSISPFCIKLETWLRLAGIPYVSERADPRRAPMGKMPYVLLDGTLQGDSQLIINKLTEARGVTLDASLDPRQRAWAHTLRVTAENSLYFHIAHARWIDPVGFAAYRPVFAGILPAPARFIGPLLIRRTVRQQLRATGIGRFSDADREALAEAEASALGEALSEAPFVLGDAPCSVDASLYAMIHSILGFPADSSLKSRYSRPVFIDYVARMEVWLAAL